MKGRVWFETLGCKANQYDTEKLRALLEGLGWVPVSEPGEADLVLVNTCAVTSVAEKKSRQALSRARKLAPRAKVAALGCWARRLENLGKPLPEICDLALGEGAREEGFRRLLQALGEEDPGGFPYLKNYRQRHRAFLKVQDGCDFHCTYCVIPSLRGPSRSRPLSEVLEEAASLVRAGTRELVLTGVCLGDWREKDQGLEKLVQGLLQLEGTFRLRLSSVEPERVTPSLLEVLGCAGRGRVCPHLHLPLQSGSDRVLKRMGRRYRAGDFRSILERARKVFGPSFSFTTDVIAGFPGEREEDFQATLDLLEELEPTRVHVFPFSPREGTPAARLPDPLPREKIRERTARLLERARLWAEKAAERRLGAREEILLEKPEEGVSGGYQRVFLEEAAGKPGDLVQVVITGTRDEKLLGRIHGKGGFA